MRIVIDMQGAQVECLHPDSKSSAIAFAQAVVRNKGEHKIILALSALIPETIKSIREAFQGLMSESDILVWEAPGPVRQDVPGNELWRETAACIREGFLASLNPDVIHISNLFLGYKDDGVTSIGQLDKGSSVTVSVYEKGAAAVEPEESDKGKERYLREKIETLKEAELIFALSEATKDFFIKSLDLSQTKVVNLCAESPCYMKQVGQHGAGDLDWDHAAKLALTGWENISKFKKDRSLENYAGNKPRLAFVSPLPPEKSGVADYSAVLIPALLEYYDITLVVDQENFENNWGDHGVGVKDSSWLLGNITNIDRVVYQVGNSHFHSYMIALMEAIPGIVVLHDFYLGHLMAWREYAGGFKDALSLSLYKSHGIKAIREKYRDAEKAILQYPANWEVLRNSRGVIVHSEYSRNLARECYGVDVASEFEVIPLLRAPVVKSDKEAARNQLKIGRDDFVVCSFGFLGETKLNHRLLDAWVQSALFNSSACYLYFVGENHGGEYGQKLNELIKNNKIKNKVKITGFVDPKEYALFLQAADIAIQLRTLSRGETSAAVMDCMSYAIPLIVNANGTMAELDKEAVSVISENFTDLELVEAIETLWRNNERRLRLGECGKKIVENFHSPYICAKLYKNNIEKFYNKSFTGLSSVISRLPVDKFASLKISDLARLSADIAQSFPVKRPLRKLFIDVSVISKNDIRTGIQRVTRALLLALVEIENSEYSIEPVYLSDAGGSWHYRSANKYLLNLLECPSDILEDSPIDPQNGDIILLIDLTGQMVTAASNAGIYKRYQNIGMSCWAVVYDLLPILMPEVFPEGSGELHEEWLKQIIKLDGAVCISKAVANELIEWQKHALLETPASKHFKVKWFHLGADLLNSSPSFGMPIDSKDVLHKLSERPTFLMVGTIEPRKAYNEVIEAFSQLWLSGEDVNLVIVGREGWKEWMPDHLRRDIPSTVNKIRGHDEYQRRLFWLEGISDEYLDRIYGISTCLVAASYGEGFGLPLIEAATHDIPIIARDIEVFREVAGKYAYYFKAKNPYELSESIKDWLSIYRENCHTKSAGMPFISWERSAKDLISEITDKVS